MKRTAKTKQLRRRDLVKIVADVDNTPGFKHLVGKTFEISSIDKTSDYPYKGYPNSILMSFKRKELQFIERPGVVRVNKNQERIVYKDHESREITLSL